jgi:anti-sigma factor RsiW
MNCEKVRELLLADYTDNELDEAARARVSAHLESCASCKAYEVRIRKSAVEPFKGVRQMAPGEHVWKEIERSIASEQRDNRARTTFAFPKPVFVMATVAMLIMAIALFAERYHAEGRSLNLYIEDQVSFLSGSNGNGGTISDEDLYTLNGERDGVTA